jgi:hypothetical protein
MVLWKWHGISRSSKLSGSAESCMTLFDCAHYTAIRPTVDSLFRHDNDSLDAFALSSLYSFLYLLMK